MRNAKLRVCASCEWIFEDGLDCPECGFGSYSARYVYGNKAYSYRNSQHPWLEKKIEKYRRELIYQICAKQPIPKPKKLKWINLPNLI